MDDDSIMLNGADNRVGRESILGISFSTINMDMATAEIEQWIVAGERNYICVAPVHSIMECVDDSRLMPVFNRSGLTTPDGMPIVWLLKMRGYKNVERVYGPDLLEATCEHSVTAGRRHYFYGGAEGVAEDVVRTLKQRFPDLQVAGTYSPPFGTPTEAETVSDIERINASGADIVWVGLGSPKQERWMAEHRDQIDASVLVGIGAAFDFVSGRKQQAPRWIQRSGLEWLFRLSTEPRRLWPRYRKYGRFLILLLREELSRRMGRTTTDVARRATTAVQEAEMQ